MSTLDPLLAAMKSFDLAGMRQALAAKRYSRNEVAAPLSWLARQGHAPGVALLLPHANARSSNSSALRNAAEEGHAAVVEILIPHSAVALNNSQAMRSAAIKLHVDVVALLLPHAGEFDAALALRDATHALASVPVDLIKARDASRYLDLAHVLLPKGGVERILHWCLQRPHKERHLELLDGACQDWHDKCGGVIQWGGEAQALRAALPRAYGAWEARQLRQATPLAHHPRLPQRL